jgi:hypothetical protein
VATILQFPRCWSVCFKVYGGTLKLQWYGHCFIVFLYHQREIFVVWIVRYCNTKVTQLIGVNKAMVYLISMPKCLIEHQNNSLSSHIILYCSCCRNNRDVSDCLILLGVWVNITFPPSKGQDNKVLANHTCDSINL